MGRMPAPSPLSSVFLGHVGESTAPGGPGAGLEEHLVKILASARSAWPDVPLGDDVFLGHLARSAGKSDVPELAKLHTDELYLACACGQGDPKALAHFERTYLAALEKVLGRMNLGARLEDAKQLLRQH